MELLLYSHPQWFEAAVPNLFGSRDQFQGQWLFHGWGWGGVQVSNGEQWGTADEASLAHWLLTSCWAARFLISHRLIPGWLTLGGNLEMIGVYKKCVFSKKSVSLSLTLFRHWENRLNHVWTVNCCDHVGSIKMNWFSWVQSFYFLTILFLYFSLCWVFVAVWGFSLAAVTGGYSLVAGRGHLISVASLVLGHGLQGMQAPAVAAPRLHNTGSIIAAHGF